MPSNECRKYATTYANYVTNVANYFVDHVGHYSIAFVPERNAPRRPGAGASAAAIAEEGGCSPGLARRAPLPYV
jgi:hypothetical protein